MQANARPMSLHEFEQFEYVHFPGSVTHCDTWFRRDRMVGFLDNPEAAQVVVFTDSLGADDTTSWEFSYENDDGEVSGRGEGWALPLQCRVAHYFRDARSLCGKWAMFAPIDERTPPDETPCCVRCSRKARNVP